MITSRLIRSPQRESLNDEWADSSPDERIEAVWTLTKACFAWNAEGLDEPRLDHLLREFNAKNVEYLIVGAHALAAHGHVRATKDLDIWIHANKGNAERVLAALTEFGAPLHGLTTEDLVQPGTIFQIGVPPLRVDILTAIDGVQFPEAWPDRFEAKLGGEPTFVISAHHLVKNKQAAGRLQDLADIERLQKKGEQL